MSVFVVGIRPERFFRLYHNGLDNIIVDRSPIFYKFMHDHGIKFVSDLVDSKGKFYSYQSLCDTYDIQISILTYRGLRNSVLHSWPQLNTLNYNVFFPFVPSTVRIYKNNRKDTQIFMIHLFQIIKVPADKSNIDSLCHESMNRQHE